MATHFIQRSLITLALVWSGFSAFAQAPKNTATKQSTYTFESGDGTNASAVVWIPEHNIYLTAIAGNFEYPLEGFRSTGNHVFSLPTNLDLRGMWYNAKSKHLYANAHGEAGWYKVALGNKGMPDGQWEPVCEGKNQPDDQSVLTSTGKLVVGYADGVFYFYNAKNGKFKKEAELSGYSGTTLNNTTVCYTGNAKFPLALLDAVEGRIVYYDMKGASVGSTKLPGDAVASEMFRFAFANQLAWLYDVDTRTWTSYKVFE